MNKARSRPSSSLAKCPLLKFRHLHFDPRHVPFQVVVETSKRSQLLAIQECVGQTVATKLPICKRRSSRIRESPDRLAYSRPFIVLGWLWVHSAERWSLGVDKPKLQIVRYAGASPAVAVCSGCGRQFKTPLTRLQKASDAAASLREQFERHSCATATARASDRTE